MELKAFGDDVSKAKSYSRAILEVPGTPTSRNSRSMWKHIRNVDLDEFRSRGRGGMRPSGRLLSPDKNRVQHIASEPHPHIEQ